MLYRISLILRIGILLGILTYLHLCLSFCLLFDLGMISVHCSFQLSFLFSIFLSAIPLQVYPAFQSFEKGLKSYSKFSHSREAVRPSTYFASLANWILQALLFINFPYQSILRKGWLNLASTGHWQIFYSITQQNEQKTP